MTADERASVVAEARTWIGTPYHHAGAVKGVGVDCAKLLLEVFVAAGVIERFVPDDYPADWHLHRSEERYVATILRFAREFDPAVRALLPGDIVVWKFGRTFSHGGIVTAWPCFVHAFAASFVVEEARLTGSMLEPREMRAFSAWEG